MPHRRKKPFIEKKKAVTFHLVHRSQKDPLTADDSAPQRVLLPALKGDDEKRREEQRKYGVFFDDDYDYLQHLKEASGSSELVPSSLPNQGRIVISTEGGVEEEIQHIPAPTINLPSSVFASEFEEDVGLLNKAAPVPGPRPDLDPDIVAALDDDFDFDNPDNLLEDDFMLRANKPGSLELEKEVSWESEDEDAWEDMEEEEDFQNDDEYDSEGPLSDDSDFKGKMKEFLFMEEETKSRFTEYSMTSLVMRRNEQLTLLDERFEKFFEQFDDDEIGPLDNAELEGFIQNDSTRLQEVLNDYFREKAKDCVKLDGIEAKKEPELFLNEEEDESEEMVTLIIEEPKEKWDCESILSTYSNLYNHPKLIEVPQKLKSIEVSKKTGIPLDVLPQRGPTAKQTEHMQRINDCDLPRVSTQPRSKNESKEDRKARKQAIKEERKERRVEKKANKLAFKQEKTRQEKELLNLKQNIQGLRLT
ncbi:protein LTV1 homolog [Python bivittatus]|uniref:Protein LTV1 homolog n=1 Tax=Python bivittatus TaxID=176946 RepID=A0A9F2N6L9_PYTBI|nr:protein LTV1 homolog [Python bivittatus]